jgi:VanZ family protein
VGSSERVVKTAAVQDLIWVSLLKFGGSVQFPVLLIFTGLEKDMFMMKWKISFFIYCGLVLYLSSLSPKEIPDAAFSIPDEALHFIEYALMGVLGWGAFGRGSSGFPWAIFAFCCCFGIVDECFQDWLNRSRTADVWDTAADAVGAFSGLLLSMVFWKR